MSSNEFDNAVKLVKMVDIDNEDNLLMLYGLYKQALQGDCQDFHPFPLICKTKRYDRWSAWNKNKGMSREDAMKNYVKQVYKLIE